MSKMDALRAMREAKFEQRTSAPAAPTSRAAKPTPVAKPAAQPVAEDAGEDAATEALCGHRNMSGRTCTREQGHAAKSHRYS